MSDKTTDLVQRLREPTRFAPDTVVGSPAIQHDAADEIERLRSMIAGAQNGHVPAVKALQREADAIRAAGNDGRNWPYAD